MKILITGNLGYIGPVLAAHLRERHPEATLVGFDTGYFADCLSNPFQPADTAIDQQLFGDVRRPPANLFDGVNAVVHLAAISNDPMGNAFESVTEQINLKSSLRLAELARARGVGAFVFASSCSVYGAAEGAPRAESAPLNPLTAYARSKIGTEEGLRSLATRNFKVSCLRFSTACGYSPRIRLDLVLNDFVAGALTAGRISILSDGTPWRPLIDVRDMSRAIDWAISRSPASGGDCLVVNVGANSANYQVRDLALAVQRQMPEVEISINKEAPPDRRSYQVDFSRFAQLAPDHQPRCALEDSVSALISGLRRSGFSDADFRQGRFMRLNVLRQLKAAGTVDDELFARGSALRAAS